MKDILSLRIGERTFAARLEPSAPRSANWLRRKLPIQDTALHARWSGEAAWVRLGEPINLPPENVTAYPAPGAMLLYPGGISEPELLIPYGACAFASRAGMIAGNHVATVVEIGDNLRAAGLATLMDGAQPFQLHWQD